MIKQSNNYVKADTVLIVSIARELKKKFKAICAERGVTMTDEIVDHVKKILDKGGN